MAVSIAAAEAKGSIIAKNHGSYANNGTDTGKIVATYVYDNENNSFVYTATKDDVSDYLAIDAAPNTATSVFAVTDVKSVFSSHRLLITGSSQNDTVNLQKLQGCTINGGGGHDSVYLLGNGNEINVTDSLSLTLHGANKILTKGNRINGNDNDNYFAVTTTKNLYITANHIYAGGGNDIVDFSDSTPNHLNYIYGGDGNDSIKVTGGGIVSLGSENDTLQLGAGARVSLYDLTAEDALETDGEITAATWNADDKSLTFDETGTQIVFIRNSDVSVWQNVKVNGGKTLGVLTGLVTEQDAPGGKGSSGNGGNNKGDGDNSGGDGGTNATDDASPHGSAPAAPRRPLPPAPARTPTVAPPSVAPAASAQPSSPATGTHRTLTAAACPHYGEYIQIAAIENFTLRADGNLDFIDTAGDTITALWPQEDEFNTSCTPWLKFIDIDLRKIAVGYGNDDCFAPLFGNSLSSPIYWDGTRCYYTGSLIGGRYNDTIKGDNGSTVYGGKGDDRIELAPGNNASESVIFRAKSGCDSVYGFQTGFEYYNSDVIIYDSDEISPGFARLDSLNRPVFKIGTSRLTLSDGNATDSPPAAYVLLEDKQGKRQRVAIGTKDAVLSTDPLTGEYADLYVGNGRTAVDFSDYGKNTFVVLNAENPPGCVANFLNIHTVIGAADYDNILIGSTTRGDSIVGGKGGYNSLWGGDDHRDTLVGGENAQNTFFYGLADGNDIIFNIQQADKVILFDLSVGDLNALNRQGNGYRLSFTGGSLTLADAPDGFVVSFNDASFVYKDGNFVVAT